MKLKTDIFDINWIKAPCRIKTRRVVLKAALNTVLPAIKAIPCGIIYLSLAFVLTFGVGWLCQYVYLYSFYDGYTSGPIPVLLSFENAGSGFFISCILFVVVGGFCLAIGAIIKRYKTMYRLYRRLSRDQS